MADNKQFLELYKTHRVTFLLWVGIALYLSLNCIFSKHPEGVVSIYYQAAYYWLTSQNVYLDTCPAFVYFPQSAALISPFALFPFLISNILWHIVLTVLFATSLLALVNITNFPKQKTFLGLSLVILPLAQGALVQGQMGVLVTSILFFMLSAIYHQRWWTSAILLGLAVAFKPTCLVFFGLFFAIYPGLRLKLFAIVAGVLLLPFLLQHPSYVIAQYYNYYATTQTLVTFSDSIGWANFWTLLRSTTGIVVSKEVCHLISGGVALLTLLLGYLAYKKPNSEKYNFFYIYALGGIYLMLFNPRTENNNYMMVMPIFILFFYHFWYDLKEKKLYLPLAACTFFMCINHSLSNLLHVDNLIIRPICIILLAIQLLVFMYKNDFITSKKSDNQLLQSA